MVKFLLYSILSYRDNSLRMMQCAYESVAFKLLTRDVSKGNIHHSSLGERLNAMDASCFEELYRACLAIYEDKTAATATAQTVIRFNSTIVFLSAALPKTGYHLKGGDAAHLRQLKFTIGLDELPLAVRLFTTQAYSSENIALREAISDSLRQEPKATDRIFVFDRGTTSRTIYDELTEGENARFISRLGKQCKSEEHKPNTLAQLPGTATLTVLSDSWVYLFSMGASARSIPSGSSGQSGKKMVKSCSLLATSLIWRLM